MENIDRIGFFSLAATIAIQLLLDRGSVKNQVFSTKITAECFLALIFAWIFFVHSLKFDLGYFLIETFWE